MMHRVALGQFFIQVFQFSSVIIIPLVLYTHLDQFVAPTRRANGRSLRIIQKEMFFRKYGSIMKVHSIFSSLNCWCNYPFNALITVAPFGHACAWSLLMGTADIAKIGTSCQWQGPLQRYGLHLQDCQVLIPSLNTAMWNPTSGTNRNSKSPVIAFTVKLSRLSFHTRLYWAVLPKFNDTFQYSIRKTYMRILAHV